MVDDNYLPMWNVCYSYFITPALNQIILYSISKITLLWVQGVVYFQFLYVLKRETNFALHKVSSHYTNVL